MSAADIPLPAPIADTAARAAWHGLLIDALSTWDARDLAALITAAASELYVRAPRSPRAP